MEEAPSAVNRKRRLSRKEQKARKKAQRAHAEPSELTSSRSSRKSQEQKNDDDARDTSEAKPFMKSRAHSNAVDFKKSYKPTRIPTFEEMQKKHKKSLGKWFPKAVVLKSKAHFTNAEILKIKRTKTESEVPKASILLFYQYVTNPLWPQSKVDLLMAYLAQVFEHRPNLGGRIRVAREGLNVTLSAVDDGSNTGEETLRHFCMDLKRFDPEAFVSTDFKFIDNVQADRHFKDLKLFPVQELVFYGFPKAPNGEDPAPLDKTGVHLEPADFHKMLEANSSSTVVIDVRNHYEAALGRFDGQESTHLQGDKTGTTKGAEYIDPKMRKSTDFARWLGKEETQKKLKDKNVMLFCTGGVRCERASAYLKNTMSDVKGVFQLQGGIEKYLQDFPDGGHWRGKNFVFDKREAFGVSNKDGDGGVVQDKPRKIESPKALPETKCCVCKTPWDRYLGKKKCCTCGVPVLVCEQCLSSRKVKGQVELMRCPLCVDEGVTVRSEEVEWTNNGMDTVSGRPGRDKDKKSAASMACKAAPSVLKWGGGHAANKKDRRRFQKIPCRFGVACVRKDCFFSHPQPETD